MSILVPMVVEQSSRGERAYDIYSRLLKNANGSNLQCLDTIALVLLFLQQDVPWYILKTLAR